MNSLIEQKMITNIDELFLLIDKQVRSIQSVDVDWMISFTDQSKVVIKNKIPLTTIVIASFANKNLRGITSGFNKVLDLVAKNNIGSVVINKESERLLSVLVAGQLIVLVRDPDIFSPPYSMQEFFEEVGPNIQKFATGRSFAPLPKSIFTNRIKEVYRLSREQDIDAIIGLPPLIITIGITDICNFKCEMCFRTRGNYVQGRYVFPDDTLRNLVLDMASLGVKGLRFCGEGENMLHPKFLETLMLAKVVGLRTFIITNGTMLNRGYRILARCLDYLRVSFNALTPESYQKVHGIDSEEIYFLVLKGLKMLREERDRLYLIHRGIDDRGIFDDESDYYRGILSFFHELNNSPLPIISMSCVIIEDNIKEALEGRLANDLKDISLDFLVMKSDRIWKMSPVDQDNYFEIIERFEKSSIRIANYSDYNKCKAITTTKNWEQELGFGCMVRLTRANIDQFKVHSCVTAHETYGVITEQRLPEIWASAQRLALQRQRSKAKLKTCDICFWSDFHRIVNYLFEQESKIHN